MLQIQALMFNVIFLRRNIVFPHKSYRHSWKLKVASQCFVCKYATYPGDKNKLGLNPSCIGI